MGKRSEQNLTKKDILMTNKHMKKCQTPSAIREM